jgi:hypothetical protein
MIRKRLALAHLHTDFIGAVPFESIIDYKATAMKDK